MLNTTKHLLFYCLMSFYALAQNYAIHHYGIDDGLLGNEIYKALQDEQGFLWLATNKGVFRYDGSTFKAYQSPLIKNTEILYITKEQGKIGFANLLGNVFYINENGAVERSPQPFLLTPRMYYNEGSKQTHVKLPDNQIFNWPADRPICMEQYYNWEVFLLQKNAFWGLPDCPLPSSKARGNKSDIRLLYRGHTDKIPLFSSYSQGNWTWQDGQFHKIEAIDDPIFAVHPDYLPERFWVSKKNGTFLLDSNYEVLIDFSANVDHFKINDILKDKEGNIWFCSNGNGLYMLQSEAFLHYTQQNSNLPVNYTYKLRGDDQGNVYAGLANGWLAIFSDGKIIRHKIADKKGDFYDFALDGNAVYAACQQAFRLEHPLSQSPEQQMVYHIEPKSISVDYKKTLWYSPPSTLIKESPKERSILYGGDNMRVFAIHHQKNGKVWLGRTDGLYYHDNQAKRQVYIARGSPTFIPYTAYPKAKLDEEGKRLWKQGFLLLENNKTTDTPTFWQYDKPIFQRFMAKDSAYIDYPIVAIKEAKNGTLWVATQNAGIFYIKNGQLQNITENEGLTSNFCADLFVDENNIVWVGTSKGISRITYPELKVHPITKDNGLLSNDVTSIYKQKDSLVWVGSSKGITKFHEQALFDKKNASKVFITSIYNNDALLPTTDSLSLPANPNSIAICFTSPSYRYTPTYRYKLAGWQENWITVTANKIQLPKLPAGTYHFSIQTLSNTEKEAPVSKLFIQILPPFWNTLWFRFLVLLLLGLILLLAIQLYIKYIRKREMEKTAINKRFAELELQTLQMQMNPHFIFNSLNSIQDFIFGKDELMANKYLTKFSKLMRLFLESSKQKYIQIADELALIGLYIELEHLRFADSFEWHLEIDPKLATSTRIPSMLIQPFLENAIHHGLILKKEKGNLWLKIKTQENGINITIKDDGIGRKQSQAIKQKSPQSYKSRGIQIINERLKMLNYVKDMNISIKMEDIIDDNNKVAGTQVHIVIPTNKTIL